MTGRDRLSRKPARCSRITARSGLLGESGPNLTRFCGGEGSSFVEDSEIGWSCFDGFVGVMDWGFVLGKGSQNYSVDGHGDSMYFGAFVKYQNIGPFSGEF